MKKRLFIIICFSVLLGVSIDVESVASCRCRLRDYSFSQQCIISSNDPQKMLLQAAHSKFSIDLTRLRGGRVQQPHQTSKLREESKHDDHPAHKTVQSGLDRDQAAGNEAGSSEIVEAWRRGEYSTSSVDEWINPDFHPSVDGAGSQATRFFILCEIISNRSLPSVALRGFARQSTAI